MLASGPRGLSTKENAASSESLADYLQLRGQRVGSEHPITIYSIRRRAGTDMARVLGSDQARLLKAVLWSATT